ncbi:MAG: ThiF family adenylyltransferase [Paludibacteraceae bacterium]|nr:ThiF family adenylyltransferase [Paludibacteraceae bacterium]
MIDIYDIEKFLNEMECISRATVVTSGDSRCISIEITLPDLKAPLSFDVDFDPWYPAKACGEESIHFRNISLIEYPHIMEQGRLCLHTISSPDWQEKLTSDMGQLCEWIQNYYIDKKKDVHFEHLVVKESLINGCYHSFNYARTTTSFKIGECGYVSYNSLMDGVKNGKIIKNYIVANYYSRKNINHTPIHTSEFSDFYCSTDGCAISPYIVIDSIPGNQGKFIFENYLEFESIISQEQKKHIYESSRLLKCDLFPLFIGYKIPSGEFAWNAAVIDKNELPTVGYPECINGHKTGIWLSRFVDQPIKWVMTNDISPDFFFGRGCFPTKITGKRILIMGIGAIGSMVAHTLVRGGCRDISLYDFDIKQPGNVCRSEYDFFCPTNDKKNDLSFALRRISPYVNIDSYKNEFDAYVKIASRSNSELKESIATDFRENYDLIIDCTTDDDVMYALEQLDLSIDIVNISISNHAKELVCAFSPSIYGFVRGVYKDVIKNDSNDIFYPTGCWNPTFKASYNDIGAKLQFAIKRMIKMLSGDDLKQNFIITEDANGVHFQPC